MKKKDREFSITDGYQIVMIFLTTFWWYFLKYIMVERGLINSKDVSENAHLPLKEELKNTLHDANNFFFICVCDGRSDDYFSDILEKKWKIPFLEQSKIIAKENSLFQLAIDFCERFSKGYEKYRGIEDPIRFAINWLKDMRTHPEKHKKEWEMWNKTIIDVTEKGQKSLGFF